MLGGDLGAPKLPSMNPIKIEEVASNLALGPFKRAECPFQFIVPFCNKGTALQRLNIENTDESNLSGAVFQRGNVYIARNY